MENKTEGKESLARLIAAAPDLYAALLKIAAFDDVDASNHLYRSGSYSRFDEPGSVEIARNALAPVRKPVASEQKG